LVQHPRSTERTTKDTPMLRLLTTLFAPHSPYVHYHRDDHGRKRFCDESACRPASDQMTRRPPLPFPPYR